METDSALAKAVIASGSGAELARRIGVTGQAISQWLRHGRVPAERVIPIERATGGQVTRHQLRPDLYPLDESAPRATEAA